MRVNDLADPTRFDAPYCRVERRLRRVLLNDPYVMDALVTLGDMRAAIKDGPVSTLDAARVGCVLPDGTINPCVAAARFSGCCYFTARVLSDVLTQGEIEHYATVIRRRIRSHSWSLVVSVGDGLGSRYGRTGAVDRVGRVRARRGPTDQTIGVAAEALVARLHAARCDERPSEETYKAKAISEVLRFIERPALSRPAPQARPTGNTLVERENAARKHNRAARRRIQRHEQRYGPGQRAAAAAEEARLNQEVADGRLEREADGAGGYIYSSVMPGSTQPSR